jgi:APA family basic amino acid/polyamine antiporter
MLGAGVFVVFAPAAKFAGSYLLLAILLAGVVAALNARSMRQLAAATSNAGGAYAYGRIFISPTFGFLAGIAFILGKIGSVASVALAAASYIYPQANIQVALLAVAVMTVINIFGINRTALGAIVLSIPSLALLSLVILFGSVAEPRQVFIVTEFSASGIISAAALIFFAFAGYARVATLGEEVIKPLVTVPRAIAISLGVVLGLYLLVGFSLQRQLGSTLENSLAPILDYSTLILPWLPSELIILIAASASLGSLLSLLAGISRTSAAMAKDRELPLLIAKRGKRFGSPYVADLLIAGSAVGLLLLGNIIWTIGVSSFSILLYYAIANLAAIKQAKKGLSQRLLGLAGLVSCVAVGAFVPLQSLVLSVLALALALLLRVGLRSLLPPTKL